MRNTLSVSALRAFGASVIVLALMLAAPVLRAADYVYVYRQDEILKDWPRLKTAVTKIHQQGLVPVLSEAERRALEDVEIRFALPEPGDDLLNFYATYERGRPVVVMPVLSLKVLEDITTAYAWLYYRKFDLSKIELYFSMTPVSRSGCRQAAAVAGSTRCARRSR